MALIIKRAETREEIEAVHEFWYQIFCEEIRMRNPENYPSKRDADEYVPCSIYFMALEENELVGAMRLVSHHCTGKFVIEKGFQLPDFITRQREKALEVSRAAIRKDRRGSRSHLILFGLLKAVYEYAKLNNYFYLCAFIIPEVLKFLTISGWNFKWIGRGNTKMYNVLFIPTVLEIKDENVNFEAKK